MKSSQATQRFLSRDHSTRVDIISSFLQSGVQSGPLLIVEVIAVDQLQLHLGPFGQVGGFIDHIAAVDNAGFQGVHAGQSTSVTC